MVEAKGEGSEEYEPESESGTFAEEVLEKVYEGEGFKFMKGRGFKGEGEGEG